jgi:hypothetical protein
MSTTRLKDVTIRGQQIEISVASQDGWFEADYQGETYRAATLDALTSRLQAATKRVKVEVPFVLVEESRWNYAPTVERAVATGLHAGHGAVLIKRANGDREQLSGYSSSSLRDLTAEEFEEARDLQRAAAKAQARWDDWRKAHEHPSLREAVRDAIAAIEGAPPAAPPRKRGTR